MHASSNSDARGTLGSPRAQTKRDTSYSRYATEINSSFVSAASNFPTAS